MEMHAKANTLHVECNLNTNCLIKLNQPWKTQQWPQDWKRSVLIPVPKKGSTKECSNHWTIVFISHASKVMLKTIARIRHHKFGRVRSVETKGSMLTFFPFHSALQNGPS